VGAVSVAEIYALISATGYTRHDFERLCIDNMEVDPDLARRDPKILNLGAFSVSCPLIRVQVPLMDNCHAARVNGKKVGNGVSILIMVKDGLVRVLINVNSSWRRAFRSILPIKMPYKNSHSHRLYKVPSFIFKIK
jgi:hypothetical protein